MNERIDKSDDQWSAELTPEQFHVSSPKGTDRAFAGAFWNHRRDGVHRCAGRGAELFDLKPGFDCGFGWPSFFGVLNSDAVKTDTDLSHGMRRVEVKCRRCGGHLGHLFSDGPKLTGMRYCVNSASL